MNSNVKSVKEYISQVPETRIKSFLKLRKTILDNLPKDFEECISYNMIGYVVPHSIYPKGYHCNTKLPLPFVNLANQKNSINFYHMGIYADKKLLNWFINEYSKITYKKIDMGKSCIRFKNIDEIPFELIGKLMKKITVNTWIKVYEKNLKK